MAAVETPPVATGAAAAAASASRKRRPPKGQYLQAAKRPRPAGRRQLEAGMCGILITCNMNERKCVAEAYSLLGEYGEQLYGPEQVSPGAGGEATEGRGGLPGWLSLSGRWVGRDAWKAGDYNSQDSRSAKCPVGMLGNVVFRDFCRALPPPFVL
uniref:THUMP domain-containing protein n=1 Tax=Pseudonaja textilis TaxID=8673 RepID=A0A670ZJT4_PSETE